MKKMIIALWGFLMISQFSAIADTKSDKILQRSAAVIKKSSGTEIHFTGNSNAGLLRMKNNQFYIQHADYRIWYDGKTNWSYVRGNEEVTVSNPTKEDAMLTNPYILIQSYNQLYNSRYMGKRKVGNQTMDEIRLTPKKKSGVKDITLQVDNAFLVKSIQINYTNSGVGTFTVKSYKFNQQFSTNDFRFNPKNYPDAEIIDIR